MPIRWQRAVWILAAALLLLAALWGSRMLPGAASAPVPTMGARTPDPPQPSPAATGPAATIPVPATASATATPAATGTPASVSSDPNEEIAILRGGSLVVVDNGVLLASMDLATGRLGLRWRAQGSSPPAALEDLAAGALVHGVRGGGTAGELLSTGYAHHTVDAIPFSDRLGSGMLFTFSHLDTRYPPLRLLLRVYRHSPTMLIEEKLGSATGPVLDTARLEPLIGVDDPAALRLTADPDPLVLAINGQGADHMPRQFVALSALPALAPLPYATVLSDAGGAFLAGALRAAAWFPSVTLRHNAGHLTALSLAGIGPVVDRQPTSDLFLLGPFAGAAAALRSYATAIGRLQTVPGPAIDPQLGWSSWGAYELHVTQQRVQRNADFVSGRLRVFGYDTIHIDDGWERAYGDWSAGPGFPDGMQALARYIHARGLKASIWFAPFLVSPASRLAGQHPDWLLRNLDGSPLAITVAGPTYVLDVTNPAAAAFILGTCARLRDWGYDAVKLDFLYTGALEGQRYRFDRNGLQAYNAIMAGVRDTLEADPRHPIYLTGVQQGFLPAGYFQAWRVGRDIESRTNGDHLPTWDLVLREALAVNTFAFADGSVYGTDPDDLLLRSAPGAQNLSPDELQTYATMVALGGSVWLSGDDLPQLAAQGRLGYLTDPEVLAVVRSGRAGFPAVLADQAAGPAPIWYAPQPDGSVVAAIFNWSDAPGFQTLTLNALGLPADRPCRVRDLWDRIDLGPYTGMVTFSLRPHQSYLLRLTSG